MPSKLVLHTIELLLVGDWVEFSVAVYAVMDGTRQLGWEYRGVHSPPTDCEVAWTAT